MVAAVVFTLLAWASAFVVIRFAGTSFGAGSLTLGRLLVGSLVLTALAAPRARVRLSGREWALVVLIGIAWYAAYNIALNAGERHVDAGTSAMLIQVAPIVIGVLAGLLLGEGFPPRLIVGGLIAFGGTVVIGIASSTGQADVVGVLLVLVSAAAYAVAMIAQKVVLRRLSALQVTWLACVVGTLVCLPFAPQLLADVRAAPRLAVAGVVYLGVFPTALAFTSWAYALSRSSAGRLGVVTFAVPPVTIVLSWLLLGEVPSGVAALGGVLAIGGVALARSSPRTNSTRGPRRPRPADELSRDGR